MAKIVVRSKNRKIFSIISETAQEKSDRIWNENYQLFLEFIKLYGHQKVSFDKPNKNFKPKFYSLGGWVSLQRYLYKKGKLSDWRLKLLEKAGIIWDPIEFNWNNNYHKLVEYKNKNGNCRVSINDKNYPGLGSWLYKQRKTKDNLPLLKFQKLDEIGIEWTIKEDNWAEMFEKFKKFCEDNGHQRVPEKNKSPNYKPEYGNLSSWISSQKNSYKKGHLPEWKLELLNRIGFLWEPNETAWNNSYQKLLEFKKINGHCNVSRFDEGYKELGQWVGRQRITKSKLTKKKYQKLEDVGFDWGYSLEKWDTLYELLKRYYEENGIAYVPSYVSKNSSNKQFKMLTQWCRKQIWLFHNNKLPLDRIQLLKEINFDFEYNSTKIEKSWLEHYQMLVEYKNKYGHCNVTRQANEYYSLSRWVERMREEKDKLPKEKLDKLNELGIRWDFADELWEKHIEMLRQFKEEHGHCDVPLSKNKLLHHWITYLRTIYKENKLNSLTEDNIKELNDLGFNWDYRQNLWEKNFQLLVEFKNKNGHCKVPETPKSHLSQWIQYLRSLKKENSLYLLGDEKIKILNEIGFDWDPLETLWESKYQLLVEFKKIQGHCNVDTLGKNKKLYAWCRSIRINRFKLPKDKISKLDELGFEW